MYLAADQPPFATASWRTPPHKVSSLLEKGSGEQNEDVLLSGDRLYGVFDGATSLDRRRFRGGQTGGRIAANTAARTFKSQPAALDRLARTANDELCRVQQQEGVDLVERHTLWSTSFAVVRLQDRQLEYCQIGDALILLLYRDGGHRLITPDIDIDGQTLMKWRELRQAADTPIHQALATQIHQVRLEMNSSYGVLNGEPEALTFLHHGRLALEGVSDILLFTDGLHLPRENPLTPHNWPAFVRLYRHGGLQGLRDHVRHLQDQDPACATYPRFKRHDDIAAIAISL